MTIENYGKVEPVADEWAFVTAEGVLLAHIWLEQNPTDTWFEKWVVVAFYNKQGVQQGFTGAYNTGAEARVAAERRTEHRG